MKIDFKKLVLGKGVIVLAIIFLLALMGNTNYNPNALIERVLRPLHGEDWTFNYAGLLIMIAVYWLLKRFYVLTNNRNLNSGGRRIIAVFVLLYLAIPLNQQFLKCYRGLHSGIQAVWLDRESMGLNVETKEGESGILSGVITLKNCSGNETGEFKVRVVIPSSMRSEVGRDFIDLENNYKLEPREERRLNFDINLKDDTGEEQVMSSGTAYYSGRSSQFEIILSQEGEEILFERSFTEKGFEEQRESGNSMEVMGLSREKSGMAAVIHQPTKEQMDVAHSNLTRDTYEAENWDEELLVIPYYAGSKVSLYEVNYENDALVTGKMLAQYEIKTNQEVLDLKVPVPCGMPAMKMVIEYNNKAGEYVIAYDGKGDRQQVQTINISSGGIQ